MTLNRLGFHLSWAFAIALFQMAAPAGHGASPAEFLPVDSLRELERHAPAAGESHDGVVLLDERDFRYTDSPTYTHSIHRAVKITSANGRDAYGNGSVSFNGGRDSLHSCLARTIKPNGQTFDVPADGFVTQNSEATDFSDEQTIAWAFVHVDSGDVVEYIATLSTTAKKQNDLYQIFYCNESDPLRLERVTLRCPAHWRILEASSPRVARFHAQDGADSIHRWEVRDVLPVQSEILSPSSKERADWIRFGFDKSWADEARWYAPLIDSKVDTGPRVLALADSLVKTERSRADSIAALFRYVAREIRYVAITLGEGEMEPHSADEILESKYGDCKDKSVLLISLLRSLRNPAVAVSTTSTDTSWFDPRIPDLAQFNHMMVYLPSDGGQFIDPTCEQCRWNELSFNYKGSPALLLSATLDSVLVRIPPSRAEDNGWQREIRVGVDSSGGANIDVTLRGRGSVAEYYTYDFPTLDTAEARASVYDMTTPGLWATVSRHEFEVQNSLDSGFVITVRSHFRNDSIFTRTAGNVALPIFLEPISWSVTRPDTTDRTLDVQYNVPKTLTTRIVIVHGPQWEIQNDRLSWDVDTTWFHASSAVTDWGDSSAVVTNFEIHPQRIAKSDYPKFLRAFDMMQNRLAYQMPRYRRKPDLALIRKLESQLKNSTDQVPVLAALAEAHLGKDYGGMGCRGAERRVKAREYIRQVHASDPANETPVIMLASLLAADELYADADSLLRDYVAQNRRSMLTDALLVGTSEKLGRYDQVLELVKRSSSSPTAAMRGALAESYAHVGDRKGTEAQLSLMETLGDTPSLIRRSRLACAVHLGDWAVAESLTNAMTDASEEERHLILSNIADQAGDPQKAVMHLSVVLPQNPDNPQLLNNFAWELALCDSLLDQAMAAAEHASRTRGQCDWSTRNTRAFVLLQLGKLDEARREFTECLVPQDVKSRTINYCCLGDCERLVGKRESARTYYETALQYAGDPIFEARAKKGLAELDSTNHR